MRVRRADERDAAACRGIYAPYVETTAITFEETVPTEAEMAERIRVASSAHAWLVAEDDHEGPGAGAGTLLGYAYAGTFRSRPAYRWTAEVSVYVDQGRRGRGTGRVLYAALLDRLAERGYHTAVAGMALPNPASQALHRALGFTDVGTFAEVGHKLGSWHGVHWVQRSLGPSGSPPPDLV